jgi:hypothetical protein
MLEEQKLDMMSRARITKEVEIGLEEIKAYLKMKPEMLRYQAQQKRPVR